MVENFLYYLYLALLVSIPVIILIKVALYRRDHKQADTEYLPYYVHERIKCKSPMEQRLYDTLINNGYFAKTKVPCGKYRIDIALPSDLIAIEYESKAHHSSPQRKAQDRRKARYLRKNGWHVIRISGNWIHRDTSAVLRKIKKEIGR